MTPILVGLTNARVRKQVYFFSSGIAGRPGKARPGNLVLQGCSAARCGVAPGALCGTRQSLASHVLDRMSPPPAPCAPGKGGCTALEALPPGTGDFRSRPLEGTGPVPSRARRVSEPATPFRFVLDCPVGQSVTQSGWAPRHSGQGGPGRAGGPGGGAGGIWS